MMIILTMLKIRQERNLKISVANVLSAQILIPGSGRMVPSGLVIACSHVKSSTIRLLLLEPRLWRRAKGVQGVCHGIMAEIDVR